MKVNLWNKVRDYRLMITRTYLEQCVKLMSLSKTIQQVQLQAHQIQLIP